jgi:transposase-like protein
MAATRRRYTDENKREAVRLASELGNTVSGVAKDLGLIPTNSAWRLIGVVY